MCIRDRHGWTDWACPATQAQSVHPCGPLTATVSPDPAAVGQPITFTLTNTTDSAVFLPDDCAFQSVRQDGPDGGVVFSPVCLRVVTDLPPGGSISAVWDQKDVFDVQVPPGPYWFELNVPDGSGLACFAPVTICGASALQRFGEPCGTGCLGLSPRLDAEDCPVLGTSFALGIRNGDCLVPALLAVGTSATSWLGQPLPLDLGPLGLAPGGCRLHVSLDLQLPGFTDAEGYASFPFDVPADPGLQGLKLYAQGATLGGVVDVTDALELTLGS